MCMRETSSYLKQSLATLFHQEIGSFDASNEWQFYLLSQNNRTLKTILYLRGGRGEEGGQVPFNVRIFTLTDISNKNC